VLYVELDRQDQIALSKLEKAYKDIARSDLVRRLVRQAAENLRVSGDR
jgi:hypothetical protein